MKGAIACFAVMLAGCGASPAMRAVERGDWAGLRAQLVEAERRGKLSNADAEALARQIAKRELRTAAPKAAVERVHELSPCARELESALSARMAVHDEAGAEAALVRIDADELDAVGLRSFTTGALDAWRAVGTRGLSGKMETPARIAAMADGSPMVRRAAMRASADADDEDASDGEVDQLATAARVDPDGLARAYAVRALAVIGGERAVAKLRDLWTTRDDEVREAIAVAWSAPRVYAHGGEEPLRLLLAAEHGPGAIEAAAAAIRRKDVKRMDSPDLRGSPRAPFNAEREIRASAVALLARAVSSGSNRDRLHAIALAPIGEPDLLDALRKTAHGDDRELEIAANARLVESAPDRAAAIHALEERGAPPSAAAEKTGQALGPLAIQARAALARAGDMRIQAWIERDLTAPDASARLAAVSALGDLGRVSRGAPVLADPDPSVRTRAACAIVIASRNTSRR